MIDLWSEKYRPKTLNDYVWRDANQRKKVEEWLEEGVLPTLLLAGSAGTGKTSLAELMLHLLSIPEGDIIRLNASKERRIEDLQDKISKFVSTWALGPSGVKYVILNEADRLSPLSQDFLRDEIEQNQDVCRFILTCNVPERLTPPIHSRCQTFIFKTLDKDDFTARVGQIFLEENVTFEVEDLIELVELAYPDMRKCINLAQQNTIDKDGVKTFILPPPSDTDVGKEYLLEAVRLIKKGEMTSARKLIASSASVDEFPEIYRFLYRNLDLWGESDFQKDSALIVIRDGLYRHALVCDPEINLSATLVELSRIRE